MHQQIGNLRSREVEKGVPKKKMAIGNLRIGNIVIKMKNTLHGLKSRFEVTENQCLKID